VEAVLEAAAIAERRSEHPLAAAIVRYADALGLAKLEPESFDYTPGRGVVAREAGDVILAGNRALLAEHGVGDGASEATHVPPIPQALSEVMVARGGRVLGTILIADAVRPEAAAAVRALKEMDIRTVLLTGDARHVADAIGAELHVDAVEADLLPERTSCSSGTTSRSSWRRSGSPGVRTALFVSTSRERSRRMRLA
jgi:Cd2+/Zn2+-exporting ATPase/Cu+-exporting ATPase